MDEQTNAPGHDPSTDLDAAASDLEPRSSRPGRARSAILFVLVAAAWFALDVATKGWVSEGWQEGDVVTGPILGIVRFHLVHNTGMAWGMFGDSTFALGVLSLAVCAAATAYLFAFSKSPNALETTGVALVVAGGLGNALDRFTLGYVVDFIEPVFIDFPVFNVADIGVTCGFAIFLAGMAFAWHREDRALAAAPTDGEEAGPR